MAMAPRVYVDRSLRVVTALFAAVVFVLYLGQTARSMGYGGIAIFAALAVLFCLLSRIHIPLLVLTDFRRRASDPGAFVLDAAILAFVFGVFGWYAAAVLHVLGTLALRNVRSTRSSWERVLRTSPGVPFWFLVGFVRAPLYGLYAHYSVAAFVLFVAMILAVQSAYIFLWFDLFFALRSGQRLEPLWRGQSGDIAMWAIITAQAAWAYGGIVLYLDHRTALAVAAFVPLPIFALLLRREHRSGIENLRLAKARDAMEAVLKKEDPRPYLTDLLRSVQSELLNETLAIYMPGQNKLGFASIVHAGPLDLPPAVESEIQMRMWRLATQPEAAYQMADDGSWVVYGIHANDAFLGGLVVWRHEPLIESIHRRELQLLAEEVAPVLRSLKEIVAAQDAATVDGLTALLHRAGVDARLKRMFHSLAAPTRCVALMLDVDHFKNINDSAGHAKGDLVLRAVAEVIAENCRAHDIVGRYGGEEFLIVLTEADAREALAVAERIRAAVHVRLDVTVSVGIAPLHDGDSAEMLVSRADRAMYEAKRGGRDRCVLARV